MLKKLPKLILLFSLGIIFIAGWTSFAFAAGDPTGDVTLKQIPRRRLIMYGF